MKSSLQDFITKIFTTLKNNLKTVAFTGNYYDLSNRPTIPNVGNGTITITQNGTTKGTFTTNQNGNTTVELTDNNTTYSNFVKSGSGAKSGLVPAPSTTAGTTKYLREDGTWTVPPDTNTDTKVTAVGNHYTPSGGTTTSASGGTLTDITNSSSGVQVVTGVTKDAAGHVTGVTSVALKSTNTNTTYGNMTGATSSAAGSAGLVPAPAAGKQNSFLRGDGTWYTTVTIPSDGKYIGTYENPIFIDGSTSSFKSCSYALRMMSGASSSADGKYGLVPAPTAGKQASFLRGDGTWAVPTDTNTWRPLGTGASDAAAGNHTHNYLPLSGGTMTGCINTKENVKCLEFRSANTNYNTHMSYQTSGNEALVLGFKNSVTSFMIAHNEDSANIANDRWTKITPSLQVKGKCVAINKLIANNATPSYTLDVNGTCNVSSSISEGGTLLSSKYLSITGTASNASNAIGIQCYVTNSSSATLYSVPFINGSTDSTGYLARINDGFRYKTLQGTSSANGYSILKLGNDQAGLTSGKKAGYLQLSGYNQGYVEFNANTWKGSAPYVLTFNGSATVSPVVNFPNDTGTLMITNGLKSAKWKVSSNPGLNKAVTNSITISSPGIYLLILYVPYITHTAVNAFGIRNSSGVINDLYLPIAANIPYGTHIVLWNKTSTSSDTIYGSSEASAAFATSSDYWSRGGLYAMKICSKGVS